MGNHGNRLIFMFPYSIFSGGSRNLKTGGRGFLGVLGLLHTYPMFCSESREQNTYCKHCVMATIKVYAWYTVKIYKYKPAKKKSNRWARARRAGAGSAFDFQKCWKTRYCAFRHSFSKLNLIHQTPLFDIMNTSLYSNHTKSDWYAQIKKLHLFYILVSNHGKHETW